jgi:hypothetical protein
MPSSGKLLDQGFKKALQEAATLDQQRVTRDDDFGLFPGHHAPSNVELVEACENFYDQHQVVIDAAIEGAVKFLRTPHGIAYVKALQASFESPEPNPLSVELASRILHSEELSFLSSPDGIQGLQGVGIGASVGAALPQAGVLAGADIVFEKADIILRAWAGANGPDKPATGSASIGLELGFFTNTPTKGVITGSFVDAYVPYPEFPAIIFVRLILIEQRLNESGDFVPCGISVQLPLGINWAPEQAVITAKYWAYQWASKPKPQFATLSVAPSQIASKAPAVSLSVKLTNTSTQDVTLRKGDTIAINMPSYFQPTDVGNMKVVGLPKWTFSPPSGNKLTLTLNEDWTWQDQATIPTPAGFNITNVGTNQAPSSGDTELGNVMLVLTYAGANLPVVKNATLNLVNRISTGKIVKWNVDLGQQSDFTLVPDQPSEGVDIDIKSAPGMYEVQQLTKLFQKSTGFTWILGYVFEPDPRFSAAWLKANAVPVPKVTLYQGQAVAGAGTVSCFWKNTGGTYPVINITVGPLTAP